MTPGSVAVGSLLLALRVIHSGATTLDVQGADCPNLEGPPVSRSHEEKQQRPIVDCRIDADMLDTCDYETLCFDGEQYFIVAATVEKDVEDATYHFEAGEKKAATPLNYLDHYAFTSWEQMLQRGPVEWLPDGTKFVTVEQNPNLYHFASFFMPVWTDVLDRPEGSVYFMNTEEKCLTPWKRMLLAQLLSRGRGLFSEQKLGAWLDGMPQRPPELPKPSWPILLRDHLWQTPEEPVNHCSLNGWKLKMPYAVCARNARTFAFRQHVLGGWRDHATLRGALKLLERPYSERQNSPRVTIVGREKGPKRRFRNPEELVEVAQQLPSYLNVSVRYEPGMPTDPREQAELMAETDVLVTVHGAGLTNGMFLSQNAAVIEVFPFAFLQTNIYREMLQRAGIYHRALHGVFTEAHEKELMEMGEDYQREGHERKHQGANRVPCQWKDNEAGIKTFSPCPSDLNLAGTYRSRSAPPRSDFGRLRTHVVPTNQILCRLPNAAHQIFASPPKVAHAPDLLEPPPRCRCTRSSVDPQRCLPDPPQTPNVAHIPTSLFPKNGGMGLW
uniref:Glycosyltransferase 61 catalytic domain-containing protein n=1 Tax=Chromera velia CCMP2878 TaxID=1169474 RepID=A0A0G4HNN0_9ALVE|eukprot:Cvel_29569.t1-p1 / transcript=Cvel_29569.t1 / gene=Cvel_29569 / organism=Chromera_velia_CCMP2878 / gene_product=hypothetical protein / transcript_product=hypothetical protein / location=Cvel_scaffold4065:3336-7363(+) / protein_length=555 / sequence_SO=supercontig / SO=protein_coding / is_pseudo=false